VTYGEAVRCRIGRLEQWAEEVGADRARLEAENRVLREQLMEALRLLAETRREQS